MNEKKTQHVYIAYKRLPSRWKNTQTENEKMEKTQLTRAHGDCGTGWVLPGPELVLVKVQIGVRDLSREAEKNASV